MDYTNIDYKRLVSVAIGGALTALAADFIYTRYGDELRGILGEFIAAQQNLPQAPTVDGESA